MADTLRLFEKCLDDLREIAPTMLSGLSSNQAKRLRTSIQNHFEGDGSDALHQAAMICANTGGGRPQDVTRLRALLRYGLWVLLGDDWISIGER